MSSPPRLHSAKRHRSLLFQTQDPYYNATLTIPKIVHRFSQCAIMCQTLGLNEPGVVEYWLTHWRVAQATHWRVAQAIPVRSRRPAMFTSPHARRRHWLNNNYYYVGI